MEVGVETDTLSSLTFVNKNEEIYIDFNQLVKYLQDKRQNSEPLLFSSNILKEIRNHQNGIIEEDGKKLVTISSFIRYAAKHHDQQKICQQIIKEIAQQIVFQRKPESNTGSVYEFYKDVVKCIIWSDELLDTVNVNESKTLYKDHQARFTELEWKRICLFEHHFAKHIKENLTYEKELQEKQKFLNHLADVQKVTRACIKKCESSIVENENRKAAAYEIEDINFISAEIKHSYSVIDKGLNETLKEYISNYIKCVSLSCNQLCTCHDGEVHVFVKIDSISTAYISEISELIKSYLNNNHGLSCSEIVYLQKGTLDNYVCTNCSTGSIHRFELQNAYFARKLSQSLVEVSSINNAHECGVAKTFESNDQQKLCLSCFDAVIPWVNERLDWHSINIEKEWLLYVPLEIQNIFLTLFINKDTLKKSENKRNTLLNKLTKLYCLFDTALASYNRNYCGVIQQLNTEELAINYHALSTVFNITSSCGITKSLKAAERWLKRAADTDRNLFETFIKQYKLLYQSVRDDSPTLHRVNLQQCFVVLFMDNLVRLSVHEDPKPGHSRTSQICTLPITLKGVPKDSIATQSWHGEDCLEKAYTDSCLCMESKQLNKDELSLLTKDTIAEASSWTKFSLQATWGLTTITEFQSFLVNTVCKVGESEQAEKMDVYSGSAENECTEIDNDDSETGNIHLEDLESQFENSFNLNNTVEEDDFISEISSISVDETGYVENIVDSLYHHETIHANENNMGEDCKEDDSSMTLLEFKVPPMLCRHPVPATGRDDDIVNLRNILSDMVQKLGRNKNQKDRILFAPDHKISKNLLKLMKENTFYQQFLPEFPVLHLRKSKIVNLFGAYNCAGLLHLLKYMKDSEQEDDWMKLLTLQNIDTASRNVCRLSMALHSALLVAFYQHLDIDSQHQLKEDLQNSNIANLNTKWRQELTSFVEYGKLHNATFALHVDIMQHCDEIFAICTAERIGGPEGYSLLLAAVKRSLPFAFLNGASSYASFCVDLLHIHYGAGIFHKNMKMSLFSTPHKDGSVNVALDTQREMDHKDAIKGFRPRSTIQSVIPRMSVIDHFNEVQKARQEITGFKSKVMDDTQQIDTSDPSGGVQVSRHAGERCQLPFSEKDYHHAIPVCNLLIRLQAFDTEECIIPYNIYESQKKELPCEILDERSYEAGTLMLKKYVAQQGLFGLTVDEIHHESEVYESSKLMKKAKLSKSVTMRRVSKKVHTSTPINYTESKRKAQLKKETKILDCMSSSMNTCQSLVNPDGSKTAVQKARGVRKALLKVMSRVFTKTETSEIEKTLHEEGVLISGMENILRLMDIRDNTAYATMEFAGIKFKTKATSGEQYLKHIENGIIRNIMYMFPNLNVLVICEEKYSFTPDDFKSATREKRQKHDSVSIAHLKHGDEILSDHKLSKSATVNTGEGKRMISNYLARNTHKLGIKKSLEIVIDSELVVAECPCNEQHCNCPAYTHPVVAVYSKDGHTKKSVMTSICQRKGEAEMAQVDWLSTLLERVEEGQNIVSVVTSGDVDSILIHLFALSLHWPRNDDGTFKRRVYVLLQKAMPELYNVTKLIEIFESYFGFKYAAANIAVICCMGGNDFVPKLNGMTHEKWIIAFLDNPKSVQQILNFVQQSETEIPKTAQINRDLFYDIVKHLYCPNSFSPDCLSLTEVRQMSIKLPGKDFRHPTSWMPAKEALQSLSELIQCQVDYLFTAFSHFSQLPEFLGRGCLEKDENGIVRYDFGPTSKTYTKEDLLVINESQLLKKMQYAKKNKRGHMVFTPEKDTRKKRRPKMSTPK